MTTADDVLRTGLALPRSYQAEVRGRRKLRVGQIVYVALSRDEQSMGFGYPRAERDGLVASDPETFFLPTASDLRFQWVCAHLAPLDGLEMRELVTDAWRMCVPKMLHDLPELPVPAAAAWQATEQQDWATLRTLLDPDVTFHDRGVEVVGASRLLTHLADHPTPRPPTEVEVRGGRLLRWTRR